MKETERMFALNKANRMVHHAQGDKVVVHFASGHELNDCTRGLIEGFGRGADGAVWVLYELTQQSLGPVGINIEAKNCSAEGGSHDEARSHCRQGRLLLAVTHLDG